MEEEDTFHIRIMTTMGLQTDKGILKDMELQLMGEEAGMKVRQSLGEEVEEVVEVGIIGVKLTDLIVSLILEL